MKNTDMQIKYSRPCLLWLVSTTIACLLVIILEKESLGQRPDSFPTEIAERLLAQAIQEKNAAESLNSDAARYVIKKKAWNAGGRILVAFYGGTPDLHKAIVEEAAKWTRYANLNLDFGFDQVSGSYRSWSPTDTVRKAHIRIGFFPGLGYWSHVGDSSVSKSAPLTEPTMNFEGFDERWPYLMPDNWRTVVQHEFGHALGLRHEHQRQICTAEFRWNRGNNDEPSVYDIFLAEYEWSKPRVDLNLLPVLESDDDASLGFDRDSIMTYKLHELAFTRGKQSVCYVENENSDISAMDALAVAKVYPKSVAGARADIRKLMTASAEVVSLVKSNLSADERNAISLRIDTIIESRKPVLYIHIQRESDRESAESLQKSASLAGFVVPEIENVSRKGLRSGKISQVRYFRGTDAEYARKAANLLTTPAKVIHLKSFANEVTKNTIEIWLP